MPQGIVVCITDCMTDQPITANNLTWGAPAGQVTLVDGLFASPVGNDASGCFEIIVETGTQIDISSSFFGNLDYYASTTLTVIEGQTFYNICLMPTLTFLIVHIVDSENGAPIGQSRVVGSNPPAFFTMQQTGVFAGVVDPGTSYTITVNGGEFYNSGNNLTQPAPNLSPGVNSMTIELSFALPVAPQGSGARCNL